MARGIYRTVLLVSFRFRLFIYRRPLSSGVYSLFSGTQILSYEFIIIAALLYLSSFILDRIRVPWGNINETGEILKN